jgi:hypothetical protein
MPITITETVLPSSRSEWRAWLEAHHATKTEVWLLAPRSQRDRTHFTYIESVPRRPSTRPQHRGA